jgi:hypothetical protein
MPDAMITPLLMMWIAIGVSALAGLISRILRRRRQRHLSSLARDWQMHYSRRDVFHLAARVASHLPVPGAAEVRVCDLIYGTEDGGYRYIFSAQFTAGVVQSKSRKRVVVSVLEPHGRSESTLWTSLQIAPHELPLVEQYRSLKHKPMQNAE